MSFYIGVTDYGWFRYLSKINPEDINFWQPGGRTVFKAITPGAPFLFKLKSPYNSIAGIGFFSTHSFLPISMAWEIFENRNGVGTYEEFYSKIKSLRSESNPLNERPTIGCIVLTNPIFFDEEDWIPVPANWSPSIVQGKAYSTNDAIGQNLWNKLETILYKYNSFNEADGLKSQLILEESEPQYGKSFIRKVRLGQGAFRVMVTDAYTRKCAITGEKTLPVLEASHIKPYAKSGPHFIANGLLLRSDIHKLFDNGYLTITNNLIVEVSKKIKEEFENGREYYALHGKTIVNLPTKPMDRPSSQFLEWHNENVFRS
ncbi:MAG: HNH endonuclease [Fulvivirga sp.]